MGLIRKLFWVTMFVAATFAWVVLFEHGHEKFQEGAKIEWENLRNLVTPVEKKPDTSDQLPQ